MNFVAEDYLTDRRQYLKLAIILLMAISLAFCTVTDSYGWGSAKGIASTHNKIVSLALDYLEKDPGFKSSLFPDKDLILSNDWVIPTKGGMVGPGPDGDGNSLYSSHYYNPITADGGAPDAISYQLESFLLQKIQLGQTTIDSVGKSAAWSAHYMADMNVPYHVVGTSWKTAFNRKGSSLLDSANFTVRETGPHELYNHPRSTSVASPRTNWGADNNFKEAVETFFFFFSPGSTVDWFDPWYLNGNTIIPSASLRSFAGSHAIWELWAARNVIDDQITTQLDVIIAKRGQYDPRWKNKRAQWGKKFYEPVLIVSKQYAQAVALGTRAKILDIWRNPEIGIANAVWTVSTMYRGSMTSLEPAVSVRTPSAGVHDVIVTLTNGSDINSHSNIEVNFSLNDDRSVERYSGAIGPNSSGEVKFRIKDSSLKNIKGKIEVRSDSDKCPDLGYSLRRINVDVDNTGAESQPEMVVVPELIGKEMPRALEIIKKTDFVPVPISIGPAPSEGKSNRIIEQTPAPYSSVTRGTSVEFRYYGEWIKPEIPPDREGAEEADTDNKQEIPLEQDLSDVTNDSPDDALEGYVGGLVIVGNTTITAGKGVSYIACDAAGKPYPASASYIWHSMSEDVLVLANSGNPASGSAIKEGKATIYLSYDGIQAYLDVTIRPGKEDKEGGEKKPLFSSAGGEKGDEAQKDEGQKSLFSSAGGEKDDASEKDEGNKSLFSSAGGEKNNNDNDGGISLLGVSTGNKKPKPPTIRKNNPTNIPDGKPKLILIKPDKINRFGLFDRPRQMFVKLLNVPAETVTRKKAYLVLKVNNRTYYYHYFDVRSSIFRGWVPLKAGVRNLSIEASCPDLPNIPKLVTSVTIDPTPTKEKKLWSKNGDLNKVRKAKADLKKVQTEQANASTIEYRKYKYASALADVAKSCANFGNYTSALEFIKASIQVYEKIHNLNKSKSWKRNFAYRLCAQILLEGFDDRKGFLSYQKLSAQALLSSNKRHHFSDEGMSQQLMTTAEELLTLGFSKTVVQPYYDAGTRYWTTTTRKRTLQKFQNYTGNENEYNEWNLHKAYYNCSALFVRQ